MVNAGAILTTSLIKPELDIDRFDHVAATWGRRVGFNNAVYLSEQQIADRNFALGYFMRESSAFPPCVDRHETLEFYFQN
jgi:glutaminase